MKLLAIETATEACSVSLLSEGSGFTEYQVAPRAHATLIFPMVQTVLNRSNCLLNQIDAFAFGRGPGSFTGLRLAASIVQGFAFALNKPVIAISTLQAMAQKAAREKSAEAALVAIDARMKQIYWCAYSMDDKGIMRALEAEKVCKAEEVIISSRASWFGLGNGWKEYKETLVRKTHSPIMIEEDFFPSAQDIAYLAELDYHAGKCVKAEDALPVYLRDKVTD